MPDPTNSQAWNRYSYVGNRPINFNDPSGHYPICQPGVRCPPLGDQRDVTQWLVVASVDAAESSEIKAIRILNESTNSNSGIAPKAMAGALFYSLVHDGAKYDVKDKMQEEFGIDSPVKIGDNWYEYSTAGNIFYGFYGTAAGWTEDELYVGAGAAQIADNKLRGQDKLGPCEAPYYCDTVEDHYAVEFGIYMYNEYYENDGSLTIADLKNAMDKFEHSDKLAIVKSPKNFQPRYNNYAASKFYQK
ncbi:MAG: hypothetical protein JNK81_05420 [Anaerolineales bacterium]|nr:hypothetical protein [Anaerolineales bacterium]